MINDYLEDPRRTIRTMKGCICLTGTALLSIVLTASCSASKSGGGGGDGSGPTATINWDDTYQVIDGFGASDADGPTMSSDDADLFFSTSSGVGLSLLRTEIPVGDDSCTSVNATCAGDIGNMALATARGAHIWSTAWSPPASMKSNGSTACSPGNGTLNTASYGAYATYLSNYIASVRAQGFTLQGISIQNEPDYCPTYDGALMSAAQFDTFIKGYLGPTLAEAGQNSVQVIMPETSRWGDLPSYTTTTLQDTSAAPYVGIVASHDYDDFDCAGDPSGCAYATAQNMGKHLWETEISESSSCDASITDALSWAEEMHNWLTIANANAWNYWWLIDYNNSGDNEGLICSDGTVRKALYAIGNWSKFVRPGWVRIEAMANPATDVYVDAFKDPSTNSFAIVAINANSSATEVNFSLSGFPSVTSVTPAVTSASDNLVDQARIGVSGGTFSYSLPATSVVTFH